MTSNSIIHQTAKIKEDTIIGDFCVIEQDVIIGKGCTIASGVIIKAGTVIGDNVRIDEHAVIGKLPMRSPKSIFKQGDLPAAVIGDGSLIGAHVVIYRGATLGKNVMIADHAAIREEVTIGEYTIVGRLATIENRCQVGKRCKIESYAYVTALSQIGDGCFLAPMITTTNDNYMGRTKQRFKHHKGVTLKNGARIGANATILPGLTIEEDGTVAAGSVVTSNVPAKVIVIGAPARYFKDVPSDQLLENQ